MTGKGQRALRSLALGGGFSGLLLGYSPAHSQAKPPAAATKKTTKKVVADAGAPDAATVRPTQESEIWTGTADAGAVATYVPPPPRKVSPPPPPPSAEQVQGLEQL